MEEGDDRQPDGTHEWGHAIAPGSSARPEPGDIIINADLGIAPEPLVGRDESTPLEDHEPEGTIPPSPLWAMKDRRHVQWHLLPSHDRHQRIRERLGAGDDTMYAIDDDRRHVMLGRRVGSSPGGCEYCLIGRISLERFEQLRDQAVPLVDSFSTAVDLTLCGVVDEGQIESSNVIEVALYDSVADIPEEYLPGAPYLNFPGDLEITAY